MAFAVPDPAALPLAHVQRFILESLPGAAVAHSYHVDALLDPMVQTSPAFQRFSLIELNELHHQVAALGALIRLQQGDPTALRALGTNLAGFVQNRLAALRELARVPAAVRSHPDVQRVEALVMESNRELLRQLPTIQQVIRLSGAVIPGPLLVPPM